MNIVNITLGVDTQPCSSITLGRRGENEVTQVVVDFSSWVEEFGAGVITLLAMRSQDTSAYPVVLSLDGNTATWDVTSTDTAYKGSGRAEYIYTVGEQIAKSVVFNTVVMQDIGEPSETPPDPYEDWLERLTELGAETQANAEAAQQSAEDAEQSAQEAAQEAANADGYAEQAGEYASAAQSAEAASESARDEAQTAQASAEASATAASGSAASAAGSATAAAGSASDASASASAASDSATTASTAAGQAEAAKTAAQAAQSAAEDAAEDAQQAAQQAHVEYEQLSGEVDDLSDEVSQQKSAIDDLSALVDRKAGMLVDTVSGAIASFVPDSTIDNLLGVTVDIEPAQDLHGYDNPWPAGGNINKLDPTVSYSGLTYNPAVGRVFTPTVSAKKWTDNGDGTFGITLGDWEQAGFVIGPLPSGAVCFSFASATGGLRITVFVMDSEYAVNRVSLNRNPITEGDAVAVNTTFSGTDTYLGVYIGGAAQAATISQPYVYTGADASIRTYYPYSNECPISGWDSVNVWNKPTHDTSADPTVTIQLGQTVYGGTMDVTAGKMYTRPYFPSYNGQTLIGPWVSSMDAYTPGASPTVGAQVVDMGGAVTESTLDPVTISTISGQTNNVWADAGDVSVDFAADIKAYIDRMNQPTEDDMIANSLIAANKYFTVNNRLFLSTASIAAGAMIIPGTNCTETSLAAALNALNA